MTDLQPNPLDKPRWLLRPPEDGDIAFICNSWLKSYRSAAAVSGVPNSLYYESLHAIVTRLLTKSNIVIAVDPAEPKVIFGWGCGEAAKDGTTLHLHFIYVKHALRNFGIAKALEAELLKLPHTSVRYTFRTSAVFNTLSKRNYIYDPFAANRE